MVCVYIHFKLGNAAEPCFKMIVAGADIYVGDKDKGCSFFPWVFAIVIIGEEDGSERVTRITKICSFTSCNINYFDVPHKNASCFELISEFVKKLHTYTRVC
jgi:hypothetical protein